MSAKTKSPSSIEYRARMLTRQHTAAVIKDLRKGLSLSQEGLAKAAQSNLAFIREIEDAGSAKITEEVWTNLCAALKMPKERVLKDITDAVAVGLFYDEDR